MITVGPLIPHKTMNRNYKDVSKQKHMTFIRLVMERYKGRVCKPRAKVLLLEHVRLNHAIIGPMQGWLTPLWRKLCGGCHLNCNTVALIEEAGFTIEKIQSNYKGFFLVIECTNQK